MAVTRDSTNYLRAMIDSLEDELLVIDQDYRIIEVSDAVLRRRGKTREEVLGKYCYDISHGLPELCHPPRRECPLQLVWETGKAARATHLHVYESDGAQHERYVDVIASPVKDERGKVIAVAELLRDVTEAKKLELKIAEAHRSLLALNTISSVVSQSLDLDTVLRSALDKTLEIMKVDTGGILLWDEERQMLCYRVYHGLSDGYVQGVCCRLGEGVAGRVAQTGEAILLEDISKDPRAAHPGLIAAEGLKAFASVPLRSKEKVLGVLNIASHDSRKFSGDDLQLLTNIAAQVAVAVENAKLHHEIQRQDVTRGELLREIFSIQEEERKRIARELHDETSQTLASLVANLEAVVGTLPADAAAAKGRLKKLQSLSIGILDGMHRLIYELRPTLLDDLGLVAATRWLAEQNLKSAGMTINFRVVGLEKRLPTQLETTVFRVIQEAITNMARHARATRASVSLHFTRTAIKVDIKDNGVGFDVEEAISSKQRPRGLGLLGMKERVELFNGSFNIRSYTGDGTEIRIRIPLE